MFNQNTESIRWSTTTARISSGLFLRISEHLLSKSIEPLNDNFYCFLQPFIFGFICFEEPVSLSVR